MNKEATITTHPQYIPTAVSVCTLNGPLFPFPFLGTILIVATGYSANDDVSSTTTATLHCSAQVADSSCLLSPFMVKTIFHFGVPFPFLCVC